MTGKQVTTAEKHSASPNDSKNSSLSKHNSSSTPSVAHPFAQRPTVQGKSLDDEMVTLQSEQEMLIAKTIAGISDRGALPSAAASNSVTKAAASLGRLAAVRSPGAIGGNNGHVENDDEEGDDEDDQVPTSAVSSSSAGATNHGAERDTPNPAKRKRGRPPKPRPSDELIRSLGKGSGRRGRPPKIASTSTTTPPAINRFRTSLIEETNPVEFPKSKYRGVSWDRRMNMWRAKANGVHIGFFAEEQEAAGAYDTAKISLLNKDVSSSAPGSIAINFPEKFPQFASLIRSAATRESSSSASSGAEEEDDNQAGGARPQQPQLEPPPAAASTKPAAKKTRTTSATAAGGGGPGATAAKKSSENPSMYRGVMWDYGTRSWRSKIKVRSKTWYLGVFADEQQAARAYDSAACFVCRDRSTLNFPDTDYSSTPLPRPPPTWVIQYVNELRQQTLANAGAVAAAVGADALTAQRLAGTGARRYSAKRKFFEQEEQEAVEEDDGDEEEDAAVPNGDAVGEKETRLLSKKRRSTKELDETEEDGGDDESRRRATQQGGDASSTTTTGDVSVFTTHAHRQVEQYNQERVRLLHQQYLETSAPLKMHGVKQVADASPPLYEARIEFQGHSLCLGSEFATPLEACVAYDVTFLKMFGTERKDDLNCAGVMIPLLLGEILPEPLDRLVKGLYPLSSSFLRKSRTQKSQARIEETRQALGEMRNQYRRKKGGGSADSHPPSTGTTTNVAAASHRPLSSPSSSEEEEERLRGRGEDPDSAARLVTAAASLAELSAEVRRISDRAVNDNATNNIPTMTTSIPSSLSSSGAPSAFRSRVAELAEAARRALRQ